MRFLKANFRRYCVKKLRNASALLAFLPCLNKNLLFKNCFVSEGLVFSCSVVLLWRSHTDVSVPKSAAMCGKTNSSGALGLTLLSLIFQSLKSKSFSGETQRALQIAKTTSSETEHSAVSMRLMCVRLMSIFSDSSI